MKYLYCFPFFALFLSSLFARVEAPGIVISASELPETQYIGSPSIVILPDGDYIASHDHFGRGGPLTGSTYVFKSVDKGRTWRRLAKLDQLVWANLFYHKSGNPANEGLYIMGPQKGKGDLVIRRSVDRGQTWSDAHVIFEGKFHTAPVPMIVHKGRIWRAVEESVNKKGWPREFGALVVSAPMDADLLDARSWTRTNSVGFSPDWITGARPGWLEGNVAVTPDGRVVNIMRTYALIGKDGDFNYRGVAAGIPRYELAAMLHVSDDGKKLSFDPQADFFRFPGSQTKFTIRFDPVTGRYWSLVNKISVQHEGRDTKSSPLRQRNVIMLTSSADLRNWTEHSKVLVWGEGRILKDKGRYGFQYLDWQFDGEDLVAVSRTSWGGKSYHDSDLMTFHRIKGFRSLKMGDSSPDLASEEILRAEGILE